MSVAVRPFERRDRDQLTALVNLHVAAVIPGVVLSVNAVLSQLEREPYENIVDAWVAQRRCLVATRDDAIVAAALFYRFRTEEDVGPYYRGAGEIRWLVCTADVEAGERVLNTVLAQMEAWQVTAVSAECNFPALACYGVPDTLPHIRSLLSDAGFGEPTRTEFVLAADCQSLTGRHQPELSRTRTLGLLGPRFSLRRDGAEVGFIEVCDRSAEMARSSVSARWADVGNLIVPDEHQLSSAMPQLLSAAAEWLLLGGVTRLVDYWAKDVDPAAHHDQLEQLGFQRLVVNERGFRRSPGG
jgi:hypothetical protein